jgi:hypothetical protein
MRAFPCATSLPSRFPSLRREGDSVPGPRCSSSGSVSLSGVREPGISAGLRATAAAGGGRLLPLTLLLNWRRALALICKRAGVSLGHAMFVFASMGPLGARARRARTLFLTFEKPRTHLSAPSDIVFKHHKSRPWWLHKGFNSPLLSVHPQPIEPNTNVRSLSNTHYCCPYAATSIRKRSLCNTQRSQNEARSAGQTPHAQATGRAPGVET